MSSQITNMKFNNNSLFKWYPLIKDIVATPKTVMIPMEKWFEDIGKAIDTGKDPEMVRLVQKSKEAVQELGGIYPVFLRSDQTSNKHMWKDTCFIKNENQIENAIANILEFTMMAFGLSFGGVVVREFLLLPHEFTAFKGMPVSKEFRFFIKNSELLCWHPYWFPSCMTWGVKEKDWLSKLREVQKLYPSDLEVLTDKALDISKAVEPLKVEDNFWSIDFCWSKQYGWTVTDMATGKDSYHYTTCPNAPEEMKQYPDPEEIPTKKEFLDYV